MSNINVAVRLTNSDMEDPLASFCDEPDRAVWGALKWCNEVILGMTGKSLMSALNKLQSECRTEDGGSVFREKSTIPVPILNLVLKDWGLKLTVGSVSAASTILQKALQDASR